MTTLHDLTPKFRNIRLLLAREKGHPEGDRQEGYDVLLPLTAEGRLDAAEWKSHRALCRVRRFRTGEECSSAACAASLADNGFSTMPKVTVTTKSDFISARNAS